MLIVHSFTRENYQYDRLDFDSCGNKAKHRLLAISFYRLMALPLGS